jgi:hypothetical protein
MTENPMRPHLASIALILAGVAVAQTQSLTAGNARELIARVQQLPVSQLDAVLPSQPFARWLDTVLGAGAEIEWGVGDCDIKQAPGQVSAPYCVVARGSAKPDIGFRIHILVGTYGHSSVRKPVLLPQSFIGRGLHKEGCMLGVVNLSELSSDLAQLKATEGCSEPKAPAQ